MTYLNTVTCIILFERNQHCYNKFKELYIKNIKPDIDIDLFWPYFYTQTEIIQD